MDQLDHAKALEMQHRQRALQEVLTANPEPPQETLDGRVVCIDCDHPISTARLAAKPNAARCIGCQQLQEQGHGLAR